MSANEDGDGELCKMAMGAHESGEKVEDIAVALHSAIFRSVGLEPGMENWSIRKTNEIIKRSGIS